jgi:hypothetical protein
MNTDMVNKPEGPLSPALPEFDGPVALQEGAEGWIATLNTFASSGVVPDYAMCGVIRTAASFMSSVTEVDEELAKRLSIALSVAMREPESNLCVAIRHTDGSPCQFAVTKTGFGCAKNYCNQHKRFGAIAALTSGIPDPPSCVACGNPSEEKSRDDMTSCASCPIGWHRQCLLEWAAEHAPEVYQAMLAGQVTIQCVRCSYFNPYLHMCFPDSESSARDPIVKIPLPQHYVDKHGEELMEHANKLNVHYGVSCPVPGHGHINSPMTQGRTPRSAFQVTPDEVRIAEAKLMEAKKHEKGVSEQLRTQVKEDFRAEVGGIMGDGKNVDQPVQTARRQLGSIFEGPPQQKEAAKANEGQQPAFLPQAQAPKAAPEYSLVAVGDSQPTLSAEAKQIADLAKEMSKQMAELKTYVQSNAHQGTPARLLPHAPPVSTVGPTTDCDVDGNHISCGRHPEHRSFAQYHDYVGMHTSEKQQRNRTNRLIGSVRSDLTSSNQYTPEQTESATGITVNGTQIKTSVGAYLIPHRPTIEHLTSQICQWLQGVIIGGEGCFDSAHPYREYHTRCLEMVMARHVFLLATIDMLSHKRTTPLAWEIIWRYLLRIADDFKSAPLTDVGMDGDLLQFIQDFGCPRIEMRAGAQMAALAKKHFSEYTLQEVHDSLSLPGPGAGKRTGKDIAKGDTKEDGGFNCVLCGKSNCGKYRAPTYLCKNKVTMECSVCAKAGCKGLMHARSGPRAVVNGKSVSCEEHQAASK